MLEALLQGLVAVLQWNALSFMLIGVVVGFWVGLLLILMTPAQMKK